MIYIIDGYNVMHAMEGDGGLRAGELEEKRRRFVEGVISHAASMGVKTIIVFDSAQARASKSHSIQGTPVTLKFASAAESADVIIGRLVQQHLAGTRQRIRVVSADWEVQKGAMQPRVERIPPRHFIAEIKNLEKRVAKSTKKDRIRWKLEHKLDVETLEKLERLRRGGR
ncbi:MAG: NYN domain-containing protein [Thermoleophilia bacterium]|nr:NYN domain-containing protein [Thermoleophilia bacterium]